MTGPITRSMVQEPPLKKRCTGTENNLPKHSVCHDVFSDSQLNSFRAEMDKWPGFEVPCGNRWGYRRNLWYQSVCVQWDNQRNLHYLSDFEDYEGPRWKDLHEKIQQVMTKAIETLGSEVEKLGGSIRGRKAVITIVAIRHDLKGRNRFPKYYWHRDAGTIRIKDRNPKFLSEYTSVFMLSDPNARNGGWDGGELRLQKNEGASTSGGPPSDPTTPIVEIPYHYNQASTFYNMDSRHTVNPISNHNPNENTRRDALIVQLYDQEFTEKWIKAHPDLMKK